jgi:hypothetical protein
MAKQNQIPENLTGVEIMTHTLLFCYNWREEDFRKAFKDSPIGWDYHWRKLQRELEREKGATSAIVNVILNMDGKHMEMLYNYIFTKSGHTINSAREWNQQIEKQ